MFDRTYWDLKPMFPFTLPDLTLRVHGTGEEGETGDYQQPVLLTETLSPDS